MATMRRSATTPKGKKGTSADYAAAITASASLMQDPVAAVSQAGAKKQRGSIFKRSATETASPPVNAPPAPRCLSSNNLQVPVSISDDTKDALEGEGPVFLNSLRRAAVEDLYAQRGGIEQKQQKPAKGKVGESKASDNGFMAQRYGEVSNTSLKDNVRCLCVVGDTLWAGSMDGSIHIRDKRTLALLRTIQPEALHSTDTEAFFVNAIMCQPHLPGGGKVWVGSSDGVLRAYDMTGETELCKSMEHSAPITCLSGTTYAYPQNVLMPLPREDEVTIGEPVEAEDEKDPRWSRMPSCRTDVLFSGAQDFTILQRDPTDGRVVRKLLGHTNWVRCMALVPLCVSGTEAKESWRLQLWSGSEDGVRVWDHTGRCISNMKEHGTKKVSDKDKDSRAVTSITSAGASGHVWSGGQDGNVCVYDAESRALLAKFSAHQNWVVRLLRVGSHMWSISFKKKIKVWSLTGELAHRIESLPGQPIAIATDTQKGKVYDGIGSDRVWVGCKKKGSLHLFRYFSADIHPRIEKLRGRYLMHHMKVEDERKERERKEREEKAAAERAAREAAEQEAKRQADEEAKQKADEEAKQKADEEAQRAAEETARKEKAAADVAADQAKLAAVDRAEATAEGTGTKQQEARPASAAGSTDGDPELLPQHKGQTGDVHDQSNPNTAVAAPQPASSGIETKTAKTETGNSGEKAANELLKKAQRRASMMAQASRSPRGSPRGTRLKRSATMSSAHVSVTAVDTHSVLRLHGKTAKAVDSAPDAVAEEDEDEDEDEDDEFYDAVDELPGGRRASRRAARRASAAAKPGLKRTVTTSALVQENTVEKKGQELIQCATSNKTDQVKKLLQSGVPVDYQRDDGLTALVAAAYNGRDDMIKLLLKNKATIDLANDEGTTALGTACIVGRMPTINVLLSNKADVNFTAGGSFSALMLACKEGHLPVMRKLLECKADINYADKDGDSALLQAVYEGHRNMSRALVEAKADVNQTRNNGETAVSIAVTEGYDRILELLANAGVALDDPIESANDWTPLMVAGSGGFTDCCAVLIKKGVNVNHVGGGGWTPLMVAAAGDDVDLAKMLLEANADVTIQDEENETALDMACSSEMKDLLRMAKMRSRRAE